MIILYVAYSLFRRWVTEPSVFYIIAGLSLVNLGITLILFFKNGLLQKELNVVKPFWIIIRILFSALMAVLAFSYV